MSQINLTIHYTLLKAIIFTAALKVKNLKWLHELDGVLGCKITSFEINEISLLPVTWITLDELYGFNVCLIF